MLYERLLNQLLDMVLYPERFAELWTDEDRQLAQSEAALANGAITIEEYPDIDLAVVDIAESEPRRAGHRFAADAATTWNASGPSALTPQLSATRESSLDRAIVLQHLTDHLRSAPCTWNPYDTTP